VVITVDTREQTPWQFPPEYATTRRGALRAGDYALHNDAGFAIERKSLDDLVGTLGSGWARFQRELDRMAGYPARVVLVEGSMLSIMHHDYNHPEMPPAFVCKRIAQLTMQGVAVLFADNETIAAGLCWRILKERQKELEDLPGE